MAVLQLVSRERPQGLEELALVPNPREHLPDSFESEATHPALIGSQDLVLLAAGLSTLGFRAIDVALSDRYFTKLSIEESEELTPALISRINQGDAKGINKMLREDLVGLYVQSVRLLDKSRIGSVSLRQEGIVIASSQVDGEYLGDSLRTAARWAGLI